MQVHTCALENYASVILKIVSASEQQALYAGIIDFPDQLAKNVAKLLPCSTKCA